MPLFLHVHHSLPVDSHSTSSARIVSVPALSMTLTAIFPFLHSFVWVGVFNLAVHAPQDICVVGKVGPRPSGPSVSGEGMVRVWRNGMVLRKATPRLS